MRLSLLISALAAAYTVSPPTLMQTGDSSADSVIDYVDDSSLTDRLKTSLRLTMPLSPIMTQNKLKLRKKKPQKQPSTAKKQSL
jgi:hypothetical protein